MSAQAVSQTALVLCVGDTSFLDYDGIKKKRQGYGPQGKGGNGLRWPPKTRQGRKL